MFPRRAGLGSTQSQGCSDGRIDLFSGGVGLFGIANVDEVQRRLACTVEHKDLRDVTDIVEGLPDGIIARDQPEGGIEVLDKPSQTDTAVVEATLELKGIDRDYLNALLVLGLVDLVEMLELRVPGRTPAREEGHHDDLVVEAFDRDGRSADGVERRQNAAGVVAQNDGITVGASRQCSEQDQNRGNSVSAENRHH